MQHWYDPVIRILIDYDNFEFLVRLGIEAFQQPLQFRHPIKRCHNQGYH